MEAPFRVEKKPWRDAPKCAPLVCVCVCECVCVCTRALWAIPEKERGGKIQGRQDTDAASLLTAAEKWMYGRWEFPKAILLMLYSFTIRVRNKSNSCVQYHKCTSVLFHADCRVGPSFSCRKAQICRFYFAFRGPQEARPKGPPPMPPMETSTTTTATLDARRLFLRD